MGADELVGGGPLSWVGRWLAEEDVDGVGTVHLEFLRRNVGDVVVVVTIIALAEVDQVTLAVASGTLTVKLSNSSGDVGRVHVLGGLGVDIAEGRGLLDLVGGPEVAVCVSVEGRQREVGVDVGSLSVVEAGTGRGRLLDVRAGITTVSTTVSGSPESPDAINHGMVEEKDGIKRREIQVGHVTVATSDGVNGLVDRLQTVRVGRVARSEPSRVTEHVEVGRSSEQVVETVTEAGLVVGDLRSDEVVLAPGIVDIPAAGVSASPLPGSELANCQH